ncbi:MAG: ankyrin repeat domain-containing protein [Candidatus Chromulinivorax sp.]|nr:ankyrin repeat domain-containing protein [Candidatus Chromulinivorax sp.]
MKLVKNILVVSLFICVSHILISVDDMYDAYFQEYKKIDPERSREERDFHIELQLFGRLSLDPAVYKEIFQYDEQSFDRKLFLAVSQHDTQTVKELLLQCSAQDLNKSIDGGVTILFIAIGFGYFDIVQLLVEAGADVNAQAIQDRNNAQIKLFPYTPLSACIFVPQMYLGTIGSFEEGRAIVYYVQRYLKIAQYLVRAGADMSVAYTFLGYDTHDSHEYQQCTNVKFIELIDRLIKVFEKHQKELGVIPHNYDVASYNELDRLHDEDYYQQLRWQAHRIMLQYFQHLKDSITIAKKSVAKKQKNCAKHRRRQNK